LRIGRVRRIVPVFATGKVVVPVSVDVDRHYEGVVPISKTETTLTTFSVDITLRIGRDRIVPVFVTGKVVVPVNVVDARLVASVVSISKTERTLTTFSVDITLRIGRVRRIVPVLTTGKVVVPTKSTLTGTTRVLLQSRRLRRRSLPSQSTQLSE
jgi:hypothetical protein